MHKFSYLYIIALTRKNKTHPKLKGFLKLLQTIVIIGTRCVNDVSVSYLLHAITIL